MKVENKEGCKGRSRLSDFHGLLWNVKIEVLREMKGLRDFQGVGQNLGMWKLGDDNVRIS